MIAITAKSLHSGIAVGPIHIYHRSSSHPTQFSSLTQQEEWARYRRASIQASEQLLQLQETSSCRLGKELAAIFQVQAALLDDPDFIEAVNIYLQRGFSAECAVLAAGEDCAAMLLATPDGYMCSRAVDVRDLACRVADILSGEIHTMGSTPGILIADDLSPSEAVGLDTRSLAGLISCRGSSNSHTAILARAMDIPSLSGLNYDPDWENKLAVLDGDRGCLYIDPDEATLTDAMNRQQQRQNQRKLLLAKLKEPCRTLDGHSVRLYANIGTPREAIAACENGCQGIGLFRSEYLYLGRDTCPTEEEQFIAYQQTVLAMNGMKVVIRTLDVGADKRVPYLDMPNEINPALGCRGIRYSLAHPELFRQQLRAILRAAAFGPISVMFPMVSCVEELRAAKAILIECQNELDAQGIPWGAVNIGTMIETPAAVIMADQLAQEVNFFSVGTNDLLQYTLAADRMNPALEPLMDPHHPALLRLLRYIVEVGHRYGCLVGVCGELAADPEMTLSLLQMDFDVLSVSPGALLTIRDKIQGLTLGQPVA